MRKDLEDYVGLLNKSLEINQLLLNDAVKQNDVLGIKHHTVLFDTYTLVICRLNTILRNHTDLEVSC